MAWWMFGRINIISRQSGCTLASPSQDTITLSRQSGCTLVSPSQDTITLSRQSGCTLASPSQDTITPSRQSGCTLVSPSQDTITLSRLSGCTLVSPSQDTITLSRLSAYTPSTYTIYKGDQQALESGNLFQYKDCLFRYRDPHYPYDGDLFTCKTKSYTEAGTSVITIFSKVLRYSRNRHPKLIEG